MGARCASSRTNSQSGVARAGAEAGCGSVPLDKPVSSVQLRPLTNPHVILLRDAPPDLQRHPHWIVPRGGGGHCPCAWMPRQSPDAVSAPHRGFPGRLKVPGHALADQEKRGAALFVPCASEKPEAGTLPGLQSRKTGPELLVGVVALGVATLHCVRLRG